MYKFFEYCFYRICYVYHKRKIDSQPHIYACGWVTGAQAFNIWTVIQFINPINKYIVWSVIIFLSIFNVPFLLTEKKYKLLVEQYKNEKYRKLKGWGVFLYIFGSIIIFPCTRLIFF